MAFETVSRVKIFQILRSRACNKDKHHLVNLIVNLFRYSNLDYNGTKIKASKYKAVKDEKLLAFADDLLLICDDVKEAEELIKAANSLSSK